MLVTLIGKNLMHKIVLPQTAEGSYWITNDDGKKLVNIEGANGYWQIVSNSHQKIINAQFVDFKRDDVKLIQDNNTVIRKVILKEYETHFINVENSDETYVLFTSKVFEEDLIHLEIKDFANITIGKKLDNDISYDHVLINSNHAMISHEDNTWKIQNFDKRYGIFVNNKQVFDKVQNLKNGDIIFIMGLRIIFVGDGFYVNNPAGRMKYLLKALLLTKDEQKIINTKDNSEDEEISLYEEKDYFSRAPRIINKIEREKIDIDSPPTQKDEDDMPAILSMGSSLTMGVMMMVSMYSAIDGMVSGTATTKQSIISLVTSGLMLISMMLFPILTKQFQKMSRKRWEKKRQQRYKKYINSKITAVNEIMDKQRDILNENYVSAKECERIVLEKDPRLWERKIEDEEFLAIKAGVGDVPLDIDITYPKERFTMDDDNLVEILNTIAQKSKILEDAPIAVSLCQKNISSIIVKDEEKKHAYMKNILMQLVALHTYMDLKIVFLLKEGTAESWDYVKMLPHTWDLINKFRFFSDKSNDIKQISKYLEEVLENRKEAAVNDKIDYKSFRTYYLIITDDYKKNENLKIIADISKMQKNLGFSLLCITNDITQLPNECKTFITLEEEGGKIFENENSSTTQKEFKFEEEKEYNFSEVAKVLSNIPIKYSGTGSSGLPNSYTFLEMYDVGRIEQLNVLDRWSNNDSTTSLAAPLGIDDNGIQVALDIHEKYHGPHGLVAGTTGSGKSELIITYILSLAINYHPDDVNFVIIDYKGGGLAGAFQKRDVVLPHLVGTITNIDKVGLQRSLDSIQSELRKRQISFNEARDLTDESTIDIYKYQKLYHDGVVKKPISHLFIICDEFAELKQQQPDFMDELISVARIGRSLGVHLILATQKPSGIVNDQIRSNSKFGVCLKVQDKSDSMDVIKKPDAAKLKKAGQFYINVGNDEYFSLGQAAWAGAGYFPSDTVKKEIDTSVEFISNIGASVKKLNNTVKQKKSSSQGDQLTNIVNYVCKLATDKNIKENQLWLDSIPETIYLKNIRKKYGVVDKKNIINPVIGEYDDPFNQKQGALTINFSEGGNTVLYGSADSGKETLLNTLIYDIATTHSSKEVNMYLLDFGSETLKIFSKTPHVGDVVLLGDTEKVTRLFEMLKEEIATRKKILSEYNGDYNLYINTTGKRMPTIIVIINNFGAFNENYDKFEDDFQIITRDCTKCGIMFLVTANSYRDLRYKLVQNFKQKLSLQLNNDDEYMYVFEKVGKKRPSHMYGRGLVPLEGGIYEFQTAKICDLEKQNEYLTKINEKLIQISKVPAKRIPTLPDFVTFEHVKAALKNISSVPIGINKKSLKPYVYDFKKSVLNIVTSKEVDDSFNFVNQILEEIKLLKNINVVEFNSDIDLGVCLKLYAKLNDTLKDNQNKKYTVCVIKDIDKFLSLVPNGKDELEAIMKIATTNKNCSFIIADNMTKMKAHQYEPWFKNNTTGDTGIWIGSGIDSQYVITCEINRKEIVSSCGNSFGYAIKQGKPILVKLLGIKEKRDENE